MPNVQRNINEIRKNLRNLQARQKKIVKQAIKECVHDLKKEAQKLVPRDTYRLKKSAKGEVKEKGSKVTGQVTFSAINPANGYDYALIQHEELSFNHPKGGQAKYLEQPAKANSNKYKKKVEDAIKKVTK